MKLNSQIKSLRKQAGYTLIELSIAIAIISVLVMTALFGVQKILETNNVNTVSQQVTLATTNTSKLAAMLSDTAFAKTTLSGATLGVWPDSLMTKDGTGTPTKVSNPFGGEYVTATSPSGYYVVITGVPATACLSTVAAFSNTALAIDTDESVVNFASATGITPTTNKATAKAATDNKLDQAKLTTACKQVTAGTKKQIWLTFAI